jgi:hypothetical protein
MTLLTRLWWGVVATRLVVRAWWWRLTGRAPWQTRETTDQDLAGARHFSAAKGLVAAQKIRCGHALTMLARGAPYSAVATEFGVEAADHAMDALVELAGVPWRPAFESEEAADAYAARRGWS